MEEVMKGDKNRGRGTNQDRETNQEGEKSFMRA